MFDWGKHAVLINQVGCAKIQAIGPSVSISYANQPSGSKGYTKNHLRFTSEAQRYQRKASGSLPSGIVTITVVLARPETKGPKIVYLAIDAVSSFNDSFLIMFDTLGRTSLLMFLFLLLLASMNFVRSAIQQSCQSGSCGPKGISFQWSKLRFGTRVSWSLVIRTAFCSTFPRRARVLHLKLSTSQLFWSSTW